jgi:hypothetical protein
MPVDTVIKIRAGTAAQWTSANPVLALGEMGVETDTQRSKFGDASTAWTSLSYSVGDSSGVGTVEWISVQGKPIVDIAGDDVDGGSATAWYTWKDLKIDNSDANVVILDGVYANGGSAVN